MSDLVKNLRNWSSLHGGQYSSELTTQAADLIEQQQQRIAELEETLKNLGDATLSSLVKQFDEAPEGTEFDRAHPILQLAISHFAVAQRNDELSATVERLREQLLVMAAQHQCGCGHPACNRCRDDADNREVLRATTHQNLNAMKREVYADGFYQGFSDAWGSNFDWEQGHVHYGLEQSEIRAEQEYPSDKDGER